MFSIKKRSKINKMIEMPPKKKPGPKPRNLDEIQIYKMARAHCTQEEMADILGVSVDTLYRRFADVIKRGKAEGKRSLRRKMVKKALKGDGDTAMLIWLSKAYLGFEDRVKLSVEDQQRQKLVEDMKRMSKEELLRRVQYAIKVVDIANSELKDAPQLTHKDDDDEQEGTQVDNPTMVRNT